MITVEVAGIRYDGWQSAKVFRSLETVSGQFDFETTAKIGAPFPVQAGAPCRIFIDNTAVMTGFVDEVSVGYDPGKHSISINGRDRTADLIDSTVGPGLDLRGPISLQAVIRRTLDNMNLFDIQIVDLVGGIEPFDGDEVVSAEIDKTGFDFLESYARQRQVFLTTDGNGNVVMTRAENASSAIAIVNDPNNPRQTNIKSVSYSDNRNDRYNTYVGFTQESASGANLQFYDADQEPDVNVQQVPGGSGKNKKAVSIASTITDYEIRTTRRLHFKLEEAVKQDATFRRVAWERNTRRGKGLKYTVVLQDFYQDADRTRLWLPNQLVPVYDIFCGINTNMLVWSCEWNYSIDGGSTTTLECVPPEAITLDETPSRGKKKKGGTGEPLKWYDQ